MNFKVIDKYHFELIDFKESCQKDYDRTCVCCGKKSAKAENMIWLEMNTKGVFHLDKDELVIDSQGCFYFGKTCYNKILKECAK